MPTKPKEDEKPKKEAVSIGIEKFIFVGGQLVSFQLEGKNDTNELVAIQDVVTLMADKEVSNKCSYKGKKIITRDVGYGNYLAFEGESRPIDQMLPRTVPEKQKDGSEGFKANPDILNR